jgi:arginyl-tRNA synthetase
MEEIKKAVTGAVRDLWGVDVDPELTRPDEQFGDYSTNVAMQLAGKAGKSPREIAEALKAKITSPKIAKVEIAGPGFLNITLTDDALIDVLHKKPAQTNTGQQILVEFGDPNPFKQMHIGHLYSYIVGDSIAKLLEASGADVNRLSYHGDVGLHVAKAIWGMQKSGVKPGSMPKDIVQNIGLYYQKGAEVYDNDDQAREEIHKINEHVYKKDNPEINELYEYGKQESFREFDTILKDLDVKTDKRYLESETAEIGMQAVRAHTGKVFKESDGAIVYDGEKVGLHTRVFITSKGLPTYETKDLGLAELKNRDFPDASRSIIITANEQSEYFKVMMAALSEFDKPLADSITHLSHGFVSLSTGKMSSRTGNVYTGIAAMVDIQQAIKKLFPDATIETENAAIKYDFLKHRLGSDIVYNVEESFSIEGNSGPYLQYAHARARSILAKKPAPDAKPDKFEPAERSLLRKITEYTEVVDKAVNELMPHHICTYLYELAQKFNSFYEHNRVIDDPREAVRLQLVQAYADTLKNGLNLLNISAPEKM